MQMLQYPVFNNASLGIVERTGRHGLQLFFVNMRLISFCLFSFSSRLLPMSLT
jgi:hypothetical protein